MKNPYSVSFGKIPAQYICRTLIRDEIIEKLELEPADEQAFKITGMRGTGKTVLLTEIEREVKSYGEWVVLGIRSNSDIMREIVANLYSEYPFVTDFVDKSLNLSLFGIGVSLKKNAPVASIDVALKKILQHVQSKGKKVLVTIDEARNTKEFIDFVQALQIFVRDGIPIYLIAAGLYEEIESIESADGLTFFLRASKYEMTPLNQKLMEISYKEVLGVSGAVAAQMAKITKGYAYAYQVLGKYMWDENVKDITERVLIQLDEALAEKVYKKIWSELSPKEKWYMSFIVQKDKMDAVELLEITKTKHSEWSAPRKKLSDKGLIDTKIRGKISLTLPRFKEFVEEFE